MKDVRNHAEEALRHSEELVRAMFERAAVGIMEVDGNQKVMAVNERGCQILGYSRLELVGMNLRDLTHPEDRERSDRVNAELREGRRHHIDYQKRYLRRDGMPLWVHVTVSPVHDDEGRWVRSIGTFEDISERKAAELALQRSEERARNLANSMPQLVWTANGAGEVDYYNSQRELYCQMERSPDGVWQWGPLVHPDDMSATAAAWARAVRRVETYQTEHRIRMRDGTYRWHLSRAFPVRDEHGAVQWFGTATDIHELKQAQEALGESELFHRQTIESIPGLVFTTQPDGYCDYVSRQWVEFTGVPTELQLGDGWLELLHPEDRPRAAAAWRGAVRSRTVYEVEYRVRRHDGAYRWFKVRGRPIFNSVGEVVRWFGVALDIEDLKQAQALLSEVNFNLERVVLERTARLQEMVHELEHFSYTITHDMRAPLRAMRGFSELLLQEPEEADPQTRRDFLRRISEAAGRMDGLITDALKYSQAVQTHLDLRPVDASSLLRGIVDSYPQFQPPLADIAIVDRFPLVLGNEAAMTQCFSNLLDNAVKFVPPGTLPRVRVWAETAGAQVGTVRLWFEDNGIGIPPEQHERIFVMFQQLSKSYPGTGIGLALVRKVAERMGGRVGVESSPGHGSRFWVELRAAEGQAEPGAQPHPG